MSVTLLTALLLQAASVVLLRLGLGRAWLRRPVTLLVLVSVVYDGVSQVLLSFPSVGEWDIYRNGVQQHYTDEANLVMSAGMLAFTVAYLMTWPGRRDAPLRDGDAAAAAAVLDWRLLALACAPMAVLTYEGRGYNAAAAAGPAASPGVASAFFVILIILTAAAFLLRHGARWFLPVLASQSVLLAAAGERTPVITGAVALALLMCHAGMRPRRAHLYAAGVLTVAAVFAIAGVRAQQGRSLFTSGGGIGTRAAALGAGLAGAPGDPDSPGIAAQAATRLDGTAFAAAVLQSEGHGQSALAGAGVPESLLLTVPSAVWHSKLSSGALDPAEAETEDFGLQRVNFLPTLPGLYAGFLPLAWLAGFLAALGALCGWGERWLLRQRTPARLVMLAGAVTAAAEFEAGLPAMVVALRAASGLALLAWLATQAHRRRCSRPPGAPAVPLLLRRVQGAAVQHRPARRAAVQG